jgi:beta-glucosidase/6-phospho-beta-glucosidase/beta-galactosidase
MYANKPNKKIGIVLNTEYYYPADPNNPKDVAAAQRSLIFNLNWFGNPIFVNGDYPDLMKQIVGARLPQFTDDQKQMLKGSADFFALNHYFSWLTKDGNNS